MSIQSVVVTMIKAKTFVPAIVARSDAEAEDVINQLAADIISRVLAKDAIDNPSKEGNTQ